GGGRRSAALGRLHGVERPAGFLIRRDPRRAQGRAEDEQAVAVARRGAVHEKDLPLRIDADDLQVADRHPISAHAAGHALAGEDAARGLALTDRTDVAMGLVHTVRAARALAGHAVPLDHAREAPALGDAGHVDVLAGLEEIDAEGGAGLEVGDRVRLHPESLHPARGLDADLLEEAELRLVQQALPLLAEADEEVHLVTA